MTLMLTLPEDLAAALRSRARSRHRPVEEFVLQLLEESLEEDIFPTPEEVVAEIQGIPRRPGAVRPSEGSLADALRNAPQDQDFNLQDWQQDWGRVEAEMKAITRSNEIREGRG